MDAIDDTIYYCEASDDEGVMMNYLEYGVVDVYTDLCMMQRKRVNIDDSPCDKFSVPFDIGDHSLPVSWRILALDKESAGCGLCQYFKPYRDSIRKDMIDPLGIKNTWILKRILKHPNIDPPPSPTTDSR